MSPRSQGGSGKINQSNGVEDFPQRVNEEKKERKKEKEKRKRRSKKCNRTSSRKDLTG